MGIISKLPCSSETTDRVYLVQSLSGITVLASRHETGSIDSRENIRPMRTEKEAALQLMQDYPRYPSIARCVFTMLASAVMFCVSL